MLVDKVHNTRFPHTIKIWRETGSDDPFTDSVTEKVLYQGVGRAYTDTTTTGDGNVISNRRKAAIPIRFDAWTSETDIKAGDQIEITYTNGDTTSGTAPLTENGLVSDRELGTMGTNIIWELVRN